MSDEEMFKFDEQLAAAFRSLKRPTKKEKNEKRCVPIQSTGGAIFLLAN